MTVIPLRPDMGMASFLPADVDGEVIINFAAAMEIARAGGTPQANAFYRAGLARWRSLEGAPITKAERDQQAMEAAVAAIGSRLVEAPQP